MTNSVQLLRDYAERGDENSYRQLVEGHIDLVYSAALRRVNGDAHLAQDIAQNVFTDLARKSKRIGDDVILSSWLYQHTCFTAANVLRSERRRQIREQQAMEMNALNDDNETAWQQMTPVLEEAMQSLSEKDRAAILLRFFEQQPLREVGTALKISEDAARMRVDRAVGKLRVSLLRRGVTVSSLALGTLVASHAVSAAPAGVAIHVGSAALAGATTAGSGSVGFVKFFATNKLKLAAGVALLGGVSAIVLLQNPKPPTLNPAVARQIVLGVFHRISAPLPGQMRFVAEVAEVRKPWSEEQILKEVQRQEKETGIKEEELRKWPKKAQEQRRKDEANLREIRMESLRVSHDKTRTAVRQEWLSKSLWRLDSIETTPRSATLRALDKPRPTGVDYDRTMIRIGDPSFTNVASLYFEHKMHSAWIHNLPGQNWQRAKFWEAFTFEQEIAFILTMAAGDMIDFAKQANTKPKWEHDIDSFAGVKLDTNKLDELVSGQDSRWNVETDEATLHGRQMSVLRLKGKTISLAHGMEIAFFADAAHVTNVYRVEITKMPLAKTPYISSRDDFDAKGFPHSWTIEKSDSTELKKIIRFKEVEMPAQFDDKEVFLPAIPPDYLLNGYPQKK